MHTNYITDIILARLSYRIVVEICIFSLRLSIAQAKQLKIKSLNHVQTKYALIIFYCIQWIIEVSTKTRTFLPYSKINW